MSQPQPGADRPADGAEEPSVTEPPTAVPTPAATGATTSPAAPGERAGRDEADRAGGERADAGAPAAAAPAAPTDVVPAAPADAAPADPDAAPAAPTDATPAEPDPNPDPDATPADPDAAPAESDATPAGRARGAATVPGPPAARTPDPTRIEDGPTPGRAGTGPDPTRVEQATPPTRVEPPAPRWSGSAPVPPAPPRRRGWGESAEPTPVPPIESPEHATPVDPWAGVDTTGWNLPSAELPALPATMPYTAPWPAHPAPPPAARPVSPPAHTPPYPAPPAARPVSPPQQHPPYPGPPAARPVSPPAARPPKQRRGRTAPPPGWQAPKGYVPVPVRRRRRWPWVLLLSVACCCGVPLWWVQPLSSQYPASATLPDRLDSMRLRQDRGSQAAAEDLKSRVRQADWLAEDTFAGIYTTDDGKRVTLFGSTGFRFTPESDAEAELKRLAGDYELQPSVTVDTGVRGRHERCAVGRADGDPVVVCTSVDHGSLTTGVFTRLSVQDSGRLLDDLRQRVVVPKQS
ncbi:hypothetical protein AB0H28_13150 [Micromonospora sp. NPDC050980]|uniref:hypothetical protein n=1 Tax=Micromonospora sp. NPDC050980 TaxID=3155161 RepID=UPI0033E54F49